MAPVPGILDDNARGPPTRDVLGGGHRHATTVSVARDRVAIGRHGIHDLSLGLLDVDRHGLRVTVLNWLSVHVSVVVSVRNGDWG